MFVSRKFWSSIAFALSILFCATILVSQEKSDVRQEIADAYGFSSWPQVVQVRYTFHADLGAKKIVRSWVWEPKADRVTYDGPGKDGKAVKVTYQRAQMTEDQKNEIDPGFINDQYWLLFPFHLVWDRAAKVEEKTAKGKGSVRVVSVSYPKGGGYTPGDSYDLFVGADNRIQKWAYHAGGAPKPTLTARWSEYKKAGPLLVSTDHRGVLEAGKPLHVFFTDVAVKLAGSEAWIRAQ